MALINIKTTNAGSISINPNNIVRMESLGGSGNNMMLNEVTGLNSTETSNYALYLSDGSRYEITEAEKNRINGITINESNILLG